MLEFLLIQTVRKIQIIVIRIFNYQGKWMVILLEFSLIPLQPILIQKREGTQNGNMMIYPNYAYTDFI